jgi:hypothetical protein
VIALIRYATVVARGHIDLAGAHLCGRGHVTRHLTRRAYRRWEATQTVRCRCGRPAHPIRVGGAR